MAARLPPSAVTAFRVLLTGAALIWVVRKLQGAAGGLDLPDSVAPLPLALALLLVPGSIALRALKWRSIARLGGAPVTWREAAMSYLGALPLGMITPGRVGEFSRAFYLRHAELRGWRIAGLVMADKYTDLLTVMAWSVAGFAALFGTRGLAGSLAAVLAAALLPWAAGRFLPAPGAPPQAVPPGSGPLRRLLARVLPPPAVFRARGMAVPAAAGLLAYGVEWFQFALLVDAFTPVPIPYLPIAGLTAVVILANAFQLTVGGLGLREGLSMVLLAPLGVPPGSAAAAAFGMFCVGQLLPSCAGLAVRPVAPEAPSAAPAGAPAPGQARPG